jgi:hypothetical protein
MTACEHCGQTIPPPVLPDLATGAKQRDIIDAVWRAGQHGIRTERLFVAVYGTDPNGGPTTGHRALHALISYTNRKLKPQGFYIHGDGQRSGRGGPTGFYKMLELKPGQLTALP